MGTMEDEEPAIALRVHGLVPTRTFSALTAKCTVRYLKKCTIADHQLSGSWPPPTQGGTLAARNCYALDRSRHYKCGIEPMAATNRDGHRSQISDAVVASVLTSLSLLNRKPLCDSCAGNFEVLIAIDVEEFDVEWSRE